MDKKIKTSVDLSPESIKRIDCLKSIFEARGRGHVIDNLLDILFYEGIDSAALLKQVKLIEIDKQQKMMEMKLSELKKRKVELTEL